MKPIAVDLATGINYSRLGYYDSAFFHSVVYTRGVFLRSSIFYREEYTREAKFWGSPSYYYPGLKTTGGVSCVIDRYNQRVAEIPFMLSPPGFVFTTNGRPVVVVGLKMQVLILPR